jgi:seryl-tRNA synthetase
LRIPVFDGAKMLDLNDFIAERGGDPEKIKNSQRRRGESEELVDTIITRWDENYRCETMPPASAPSLTDLPAQYSVSQIGAKINALQKQIGAKYRAKEDASELLKQKSDLEKEKQTQEAVVAEKRNELIALVRTVGNYVSDSVPISQDEEDNQIVKTWAPPSFSKEEKPAHSHHEVLERLDGYDPVRGVKLVGHRGYCLTNYGLFLLVSRSMILCICS